MFPFLQRFTKAKGGEQLPLSGLEEYPDLYAAHDAWQASREQGGLPRRIDPVNLPPHILKFVLILDLLDARRDAVIRLAGDSLRDMYGRNPRSMSIRDFLGKQDSDRLLDLVYRVARTGSPALHTRAQVAINGLSWNYSCLLMPLAPDGARVSRVIKVVDRESLRNALDSPAP